MHANDLQLQTLRLYTELTARHATLASHLVFAHAAGCSATGLPAAVSIAGGTSLLLDPDTPTVKAVFRQGGLDFVVNSLDEALRVLKNEIRKHTPLSVALTADPAAVLAEMRERGVQPDLEITFDATEHTALARQHLALSLTELSPKANTWLAAHRWSPGFLPAATTAELRALDTRLIVALDSHQHRQQWLRHISHYQRPAPDTGRALWLSDLERVNLGL